MPKNKAFTAIAMCLFAAIACSSCKSDATTKSKEGAATPKPTPTIGYIARTQNLSDKVNAPGTLLSFEEVEIKSELQAKVQKVYIKEGATVSKGQLLLKLEDTDFIARLKKLNAQKMLAAKNVERLAQLLKIDGVSKQEYEVAQTQLTAYDADIEEVENQLKKTEIRAPFSGTVGLTDVSVGAYITPQSIISTLQQNNPLKVDFSVPEKYAIQLQLNQTLQYTVDGLRDTFTAVVYAIQPKIDLSSRSIKVRAKSPNPSGQLMAGMFANVSLSIQGNPKAVMIPSQALIPVARGKNVALYRNGKVEMVQVETGLRDKNSVEIRKGIQAGDTIITTGLMQLRQGSLIKITKVE